MKKENNKKIANKVLENIVTRRVELKISQWELAKKLHMTSNGYFKVEKGITKLDIERLIKIATILNCTPESFFKDV